MANIREFSAPSDLGLRPDSRADESLANSGRRIAALYNTAGEATASTGREIVNAGMDVGNVAVKYMEHREVSQGAAESAKTLAGLDAQWADRVNKADPNDETVKAKFLEETVEPTLDKLKDGFLTEGGQKFAEATVEKFRNHFFEKTSADMARLARAAVGQNIETLKNELSNAAIRDPTSLKTSLDMVEHSVGAMVDSSPNPRGADGAAMKLELTASTQKEIVKAAAIGAINANPEAGLKQFSSPEYSKYISGAELKQLEAQAKAVQRAERVDENYRRKLKDDATAEASDAREREYMIKLHSDDPKDRASLSAPAIARDLTLTRAAANRMIDAVESELKPEAPAKVSNATTSDLISRMRLPVGDPRRIDDLNPVYDELINRRLNKADFKFVTEEFKNLRTADGQLLGAQQDEFIKSVKPLIDKSNPLLGKIDQSGPQQVYNFTMDLRRKVEQYRKEGKDPRDLMDPSKPDYMGSPAALQGYQKPLQQSLQDTAKALRAGQSVNLTAGGSQITGIQTLAIPAGMSPTDAIKWAKDQGAKAGDKVKLPNGNIGTVP